MGNNVAYRGIFLVMAVIAAGAVLFGFYGLYTVLMGGTGTGDEPSQLGEYQCAEFDGDPAVQHEAALTPDRTVVGDSQLVAFNATETESGHQISIETDGQIQNVSAATINGEPIEVQRLSDREIRVSDRDQTPFRLFIDSASEDGDLVRSEIDICPPG